MLKHIQDYATKTETLTKRIGMSLEERAMQLEGFFQSNSIDRNFFWRTYRAKLIKKKRIVYGKLRSNPETDKFLRFKRNAAKKILTPRH
jgi:hypothetical protein